MKIHTRIKSGENAEQDCNFKKEDYEDLFSDDLSSHTDTMGDFEDK